MCGSEMTSGLSRKRSSRSASGTTKTSDCKIAVEQKAISRDVSEASMPTRDLNHWRSSSIREISAMGVLQTNEASRVRSSKDCSGSVSRMAYFSKAAILPSSLTGLAMTMGHLLHDPLARVGAWLGRKHTPNRRIWRAKRVYAEVAGAKAAGCCNSLEVSCLNGSNLDCNIARLPTRIR